MKAKPVVILLLLLFLALPASAEDKRPCLSEFFRLTSKEGKKQPQTLDTAIVSFAGDKDVTVDLIGVIHIGDKEYYEELNERFQGYDVVLYELVAPEGTRLNPEEVRKSPDKRNGLLSQFQFGVSDLLGLVHQLEYIDYEAKNLVHADMNGPEFLARVNERGDLQQMILRAYVAALAKSQKDQGAIEAGLVAALFVKDKTLSLKRLFAAEMVSSLAEGAWIIGGSDGSAIITDRNDVALKKLQNQIAKGHKKIAIFYGTAHLPEFAEKLVSEFKMQPNPEPVWVTAWDMTPNKSARTK